MISLDDMHSENIWFSWSKPSNYRGKLRCHACDGERTDGKWKIEQCSVGPETAKVLKAMQEMQVIRVVQLMQVTQVIQAIKGTQEIQVRQAIQGMQVKQVISVRLAHL